MLTKERVFEIMGKYYGNAHYRAAIAQGVAEDDLRTTASILDEVNALGYRFSNLHALQNTEDDRFVPIILAHFREFHAANYTSDLLGGICYRSYKKYVPQLLAIYEETDVPQLRNDVSQALLQIRAREYIPEYLRLVNAKGYGAEHDWMIELLCKLGAKEVLPKLIELMEQNEHVWRWTFLMYAARFKNPSLVPMIEPYLDCDDQELRALARKAMKRMEELS